jgi:hypothetical protein
MDHLAKRRPIFHSEADFQHELAIELTRAKPSMGVRLEMPLSEKLGATDIVLQEGYQKAGIELKYLTRKFDYAAGDEVFSLKQQGAHPLRRYDVCKDIERLEEFNRKHGGPSFVIVLTNDSAYWRRKSMKLAIDEDFRLQEGRQLSHSLNWGANASSGTKRSRERTIRLIGHYHLSWHDYSLLDQSRGQLRYLAIRID